MRLQATAASPPGWRLYLFALFVAYPVNHKYTIGMT